LAWKTLKKRTLETNGQAGPESSSRAKWTLPMVADVFSLIESGRHGPPHTKDPQSMGEYVNTFSNGFTYTIRDYRRAWWSPIVDVKRTFPLHDWAKAEGWGPGVGLRGQLLWIL